MNYFDSPNVVFDDDGLPHLREHTCGRCDHTCQPADQSLFTDDDGTPEGLIAMSPCPGCGAAIVSALGHPDFMDWVLSESDTLGPCVAPPRLEFSPIAAAVRGGH